VAILVVVVLLVALVGFLRWRSSLDVLTSATGTVTGPAQVGQTYYIDAGLVPPSDGNGPGSVTVTLDRVAAGATVYTRTASSATSTGFPVDVVVCARRAGSAAVGVDNLQSDLEASCTSVRPLVLPETLDLGFDTNQLLYKVPVTEAGTYQDFGMDVDYHQGIRSGSLRALADVTLTAAK
jgi:hypothetical protein